MRGVLQLPILTYSLCRRGSLPSRIFMRSAVRLDADTHSYSGESPMLDIVFLAIGFACFVLAIAFASFCNQL